VSDIVWLKNESLVMWLASGERGISSNTIVEHLTGIPATRGRWQGYPHDPDDLWRCRKLLREVPLLAPLLPNMATASKEWAALVPCWQELCAMMDAEAPNWPEHGSRAMKTYHRMRALIDAAPPLPQGDG